MFQDKRILVWFLDFKISFLYENKVSPMIWFVQEQFVQSHFSSVQIFATL